MARNPSANRTPGGVYSDRVRGIFGMTSGAHSSTSDSAALRKMSVATETNAALSAANDNRMLAEMQLQTKLLKSIAGNSKGFGLTDFLLGNWLSSLTKYAATGLLAGVGAAGTFAGKAVKGVSAAVALATAGAAKLMKGAVLGVIRPITSAVKGFFRPLLAIGRSISGMLTVPSISGAMSAMVTAAPKMLRTFGALASKIFLPLTAIIGAVEGFSGFTNAEKILGKSNVNLFDRLVAGVGSVVNGLLFGIPDWITQKLGGRNFASALDKGIGNFSGWVTENVGKFIEQVKGYVANPRELASRFGNLIKDKALQFGGFIKDNFVRAMDGLKSWIPDPARIGAAIGGFVTTKIGEFGNTIASNIGGIFNSVGEWAQKSFENLKAEIGRWMPWNWDFGAMSQQAQTYGKQLQQQSTAWQRPAGPSPAAKLGAAFGSGVITPQTSRQSSPVVSAYATSPFATARLAAAMGEGASDALPIVTSVVSTGVATQQVLQQTAIGQVESIEDALEEIVETHKNVMTDAADEMADGFLDKIGQALRTVAEGYSPIADALAATPQALMDYYSGANLSPEVRQQLNNAIGTVTTPGGAPGGVAPTAPYVAPAAGPAISTGSGVVPTPSMVSPGGIGPVPTTNYGGRQQPVAYTPAALPGILGINSLEYHAFREGIAGIENARYNQMGGSGGKYAGRYQMGVDAITDAAKELGITAPTQAQLLEDPDLQERMFEAYNAFNHKILMGNKAYANMSPRDKMGVLGYAWNQGAGGARDWLNTGRVGADAFGTEGTAYTRAIGERLASTPSGVAASTAHAPDCQDLLAANGIRRGQANLFSGGRMQGEMGANLVTVRSPSGVPFQIHADAAPSFQGFINELESTGYRIRPSSENGGGGGFNIRPKAGGGGMSEHSWGNAIDINPDKNPFTKGPLITDLPSNVSDMAAKYGLTWGGDWRSSKDAMHFEWAGIPYVPPQAQVPLPPIAPSGIDPVGEGPGTWGRFGSKFYDVGKGSVAEYSRIYGNNRRPNSVPGFSYAGTERGNRRVSGTRLGVPGMDLAMNPVMGSMKDVGTLYEDPISGTISSLSDDAFYMPSSGRTYMQSHRIAGTGFDTPDSIGKAIGQAIVDSTIATPRQPTIVPLDNNSTPLAGTSPTAGGSDIANNPTGAPSKAIEDRPDLGAMPSIDELKLLLINSDMMG